MSTGPNAPDATGPAVSTPAISPQERSAIDAYFARHPDQAQVFAHDYGSDYAKWMEAFTNWWNENGSSQDPTKSRDELGLLSSLGFETNSDNPQPLEQGLLNTALPGLINDVQGDEQRRTIAGALANQALAGTNAASGILAGSLGGGFDSRQYFQKYADVAAAFQNSADGATPGTKNINGKDLTADQFAQEHYLKYGQSEGRTPFYTQSAQLAQDNNNADQVTAAQTAAASQAQATQLAALQQSIAAMQGNLQGALAEKAAALQQMIASMNSNLDQFDATQKAALSQQIATQQKDLEESIATQRQALTEEINALGANAGANAQAKGAALQQEIAALQGASDAQSVARRAALQDQLTKLQSGIDTEGASKRAALEQEIAGLTAAQAPMAQARLKAAQLQATAVNVGLEHTKDQLTADQAKAGYFGGSTFQDAALARAAIGARQQAAQAVGSAETSNAADTRDIAVRSATEGRSISDALAAGTRGVTTQGANDTRSLADEQAGNNATIAARGVTGTRTIAEALADAQNSIADRGATGNAALTGAFAQGRQALGDAGATGLAGIQTNTGANRMAIGNTGATTTYGNVSTGADARRSIGDALAQGQFGLTSTYAKDVQSAQNANAAAKGTYYDQNYNRSLGAALTLPTLASNLAGTLTSLDNYGQSGLARTQGLLNWWNTNQGTAPTGSYVPVQASNSGNDIANLGAGLLGAGINVGNANNWWRTPATTPLITTVGPGGAPASNPMNGITSTLGEGGFVVCWLAREIYGVASPKWKIFREWLLNDAPTALREFYITNGAEIAAKVSGLPDIKGKFQALMDQVIGQREVTYA